MIEGGIRRRGEIGVKKPDLIGPAIGERDKRIRSASSRQDCPVEITRQEGSLTSSSCNSRGDKGGSQAAEHFRPLKGESLGAEESCAGGIKHVHGHVVTVRPDTKMWIIEEVATEMKPIAIVSAGGIRGCRDSNTLIGWRRTGELAYEPPVGGLVVNDNRVATAIGFADPAKAGPNGANCSRPKDRRPGGLIKDLIAIVHHLHVLGQTYGAVGIGRRTVAGDTWKWDPIKIKDGGGHRFRDQKA